MLALDLQMLDRSDSLWNRAAAADADEQGDPLCCRSEWQLSFHETMGGEQQTLVRSTEDSILAFTLQHDDELVRVLTPLEWSWGFGTPLLGPQASELLLATLEEFAVDRPSPAILVTGVVPGTKSARNLGRVFRSWQCWLQEEQSCRVASLERGFDGYLSRRSGQMRRNLRKATDRAAELEIRFERCQPCCSSEAAVAWPRIVSVEERSWKGLQGSGVIDPLIVRFYESLLKRLASAGLARIIFARCRDEDIGFLFGGFSGGMFRAQQFSFDDRWRRQSIGNLLQFEMLKWLCEDGAHSYHMGPTMDYKPHWAERERTVQTWLFLPGR